MRERVAERADEAETSGETEGSEDPAADAALPGGNGVRAALPFGLPDRVPARLITVGLVAVVAVGVVARFVTTSNLWLDEALSVNIAALGPSDLVEALRHDGHPPLYYLLLHYWMELVGDGDVAIRALSGLLAVASLPLAWVAGRRLAGLTGARWSLVLVALSPYWIRYGSEARMYSLVMLLVLAGWLLLVDALRRPAPARLVGLGVVSGLLLLSHYWAFWLLGAVGVVLVWRWWQRPEERSTTLRALLAVASGGLLFLPWLPSFLYQMEHTGTPWAGPVRPLAILELTLRDLGGGTNLNESFFYGAGVLVLCLAALLVVRAKGADLALNLRSTPLVRRELAVVLLTAGIGCVMAYLASATFQSRYAAVFVPLVLVVAGAGLSVLPSSARLLLGGAMVVLSLGGVGWNLYFERTQSGQHAAAVAARAEPGDLVLYCPDQLGPAYSRVLPDGLDHRAYPTLDDPARVDWVDYEERNTTADSAAVAAEVRELAGDGSIFVVWRDGYATFGSQCGEVVGHLMHGRPFEQLVGEDAGRYYEPANLTLVRPAG